ncbi:TIGR04552 family protein/TIGR04562 family protein [Duganella sacchari]|uniref:TIGR04552 family protein/TIGR04562 family protein n=1 Tax=Duganella sacchari TaxID=551987 RepID=A0A1M7QYQ0_9BURK|nr:TIGR04552 family protein [Duganella sacchari]SHN37009.1 TIGR04552 family protein/TIGR04562 family protein [Duganella sacchari]
MTELRASLRSRDKLSLNWSYLNAIANGVSAIDLGELALRNLHDARQFVREYGFDLEQPAAQELIRRAHREAVDFISSTFLSPSQQHLIPPEVSAPDDPLQLLVYASLRGQQVDARRMWACAVLKVMHGIFYIDNNLKLRHFHAIRAQVFGALDEVIKRDGEQYYLTDGDICLPLLHYDRKDNKGRNSILLKLLQKAAYLAADIFDYLGVRLVFATRSECLLALRTLQRAHLLSVTNVDAERTRNTLLDIDAAKQVFCKYRAQLEHSKEYPIDLLRAMDAELEDIAQPQTRCDNPHSGVGFNSVQVTARKMIHVQQLDAAPEQDYDVGFFFEYEIQLMDQASYERSLTGPASHEAYKKRQVDTARTRVFGRGLIRWLEQHSDA